MAPGRGLYAALGPTRSFPLTTGFLFILIRITVSSSVNYTTAVFPGHSLKQDKFVFDLCHGHPSRRSHL